MHPAIITIVASSNVENQTSILFFESGHLRAHRNYLTGGFMAGNAPEIAFVISCP